jgi:ribonuclease VapC
MNSLPSAAPTPPVSDLLAGAVLDASALLVLLQREQGQDVVAAALAVGAAISAANLSEVVAKLRDGGAPEVAIRRAIDGLAAGGLEVVAVDEPQALAAGFLRPFTRAAGLSLGDRLCLALGQARRQLVLTTDRAWANLAPLVQIRTRVIR